MDDGRSRFQEKFIGNLEFFIDIHSDSAPAVQTHILIDNIIIIFLNLLDIYVVCAQDIQK